MEHIMKVQRNDVGEIISFLTSTGRIISYRKALMEAENGTLQGVNIIIDQYGIASLCSEDENDINFSEYPTIF
ncbi:DUF3892 domain-containing protein [Heyndrickxia sp. NPDC080065]|uniref:DUF3892 domain-containing protein n=1 Tax=Heyndrickxia sp. NPDC080065 TaxID=3390568 RepID=UPI003D082253